VCAESFGAAFAKLLWPLVIITACCFECQQAMTASVGHHHINRPAVVAATQFLHNIGRPVAAVIQPEQDSSGTYVDVHSTGILGGGGEPWVEVVEQPKSTAMRFRYQCEGRSAGTILGVHATVAQRTYPAIRVSLSYAQSLSTKPQ